MGQGRIEAATPMAAPHRAGQKLRPAGRSPAGGVLAQVSLQRNPSEKFDNKLAGRLRIRAVSLRPARSRQHAGGVAPLRYAGAGPPQGLRREPAVRFFPRQAITIPAHLPRRRALYFPKRRRPPQPGKGLSPQTPPLSRAIAVGAR
jgi:hypothetical protein